MSVAFSPEIMPPFIRICRIKYFIHVINKRSFGEEKHNSLTQFDTIKAKLDFAISFISKVGKNAPSFHSALKAPILIRIDNRSSEKFQSKSAFS